MMGALAAGLEGPDIIIGKPKRGVVGMAGPIIIIGKPKRGLVDDASTQGRWYGGARGPGRCNGDSQGCYDSAILVPLEMARVEAYLKPRRLARARLGLAGLMGLGALCDADAIAWARELVLPRGEKWTWLKCNTVAGNVAHWIYWSAKGKLTGADKDKAPDVIRAGVYKLLGMGNISEPEADFLLATAGVSSSGTGPEAGGAPSSSGGGGLLPGASSDVMEQLKQVPVPVWIGLGLALVLVMVKR